MGFKGKDANVVLQERVNRRHRLQMQRYSWTHSSRLDNDLLMLDSQPVILKVEIESKREDNLETLIRAAVQMIL